jgi:drug/metabolite transporter (DMT)-like permease
MINSTQPSTLARGYPIALASAVFLSTTAILIRYLTLTYALPALVLAFWRAVFVALTLLVFFALFQRSMLQVERRHLPYLVIYGFVLALFNSFWTLSVAENGAAVATVLVYCSAAFTALLGWWLLKERLDGIKLLVVALSLGGCVLVSEALDPAIWRMNAFGITTGVLAGLLYAVYTLMGRSASQRGLKPWSALLYIFAFDAVFLLLFNLLFGRVLPGGARQIADLFWLGNAWAGWGVLLVLAAVPTVAGFGLYNVSLVYLPSSVTNLVVTSEPVFTAVFAYFLLGERLNAVQIGGSLLIMAGVVILRIHEGRMARIKLKMTKVEE